MAFKNGPPGRESGFSAAMRRFPQSEFIIRRLMSRSETFCDMCDELAEAELALKSVEDTPPEIRDARRAEWKELVDRLVAEVGAALRRPESRL